MGRTNPTFRRVLQSVEDRWQAYRRALRYEEQSYFDQLFEYAYESADAAGYLNRDTPMIPILFSIILGQEQRRQELEDRVIALENRVEELESESDDGAVADE